ncbi:uncharacterized protein METZ01_LOCUS352740, partial [marine metagenome]
MNEYLLTVFLIIGISPEVFAGEFNHTQVPAKSQFYMHFDADAFKRSQLGKFILDHVGKEAEKIDAFALLTQFDPRKDLHGITLSGVVVGNEPLGTVLVTGNYKKPQLIALLETFSTVKKEQVGGVEILTLSNEIEGEQDNNQSFGSFFDKNHFLLSNDRKELLHAIKVLAKKAPSLKVNRLKKNAAEKGDYYFSGLLQMKGITVPPEANFMENVVTVETSVGENKNNFLVSLQMVTANEEAADQLQLIMQGFVALAHLSLINNEEPGVKEAKEIGFEGKGCIHPR